MKIIVYDNKKIIAVIPARGGSKGIPRKNIKPLLGKPLIGWTIDEAEKSKYIDRCIVSTEDKEIAKQTVACGGEVPFLRPFELAQDDTPSIDVVLHVLDKLPGYEYVVLLQPTSPLRSAEDIDGAIEFCLERGVASCVSVMEAEHSPYWMYRLDTENLMHPLLKIPSEKSYQRQKLPKAYQLNGAVYVAKTEFVQQKRSFIGEETLGYVMPSERSWDIDTMMDFEYVEMLIQKQRKQWL